MSARKPKKLPITGILIVSISAGLFFASQWIHFALAPANSEITNPVLFEIKRGQGPLEISQNLQKLGLITDAKSLLWLGRLTREWPKVKAGEYPLSPSMPPTQILTTLTLGLSVSYPLTITEGQNIYEIAEAFEVKKPDQKLEFLKLCKDSDFIESLKLNTPPPPTLEGYLFPDTYQITKSTRAEDLIRQMFRRFQSFWGQVEEARAKELGLTRHQVIILASIVEKETGNPDERTQISSVFHNRLRKRMRLQSDPTTIYGMWEHYRGALSRADLLRPSSYNTYTVDSLPLGPISNPGREAIQAALYPLQTEYLYFVSQNDGHSEFSRTLEEHNAAVKRFQLNPKAREGKSWRDLKSSVPDKK